MEQRPVAPEARAQEERPTADWAVPVLYLDLGFLAERADSALRIAQIIRESDDPDRPTRRLHHSERCSDWCSPSADLSSVRLDPYRRVAARHGVRGQLPNATGS